jgi:hypothetical protein
MEALVGAGVPAARLRCLRRVRALLEQRDR